jgi:choline dehydrogenase
MTRTHSRRADYVVVGAGSSGSVLARRLAEGGSSVILIEAGGSNRSWLLRKPGMISLMHLLPTVKRRFDWGSVSVPQENALGRTIPQTRGKVLGGSGTINGMLFVRGNRKNYDDWAADGCSGWSYDDVLPSFKRLENWEGGSNHYRGAGGPVHVTTPKDITPASEGFMDAFASTAGINVVHDYNAESQEGVGVFQQSAHAGYRSSAASAYLDGWRSSGLKVITGSTVTRVVVEHGRATGVEVVAAGKRRIIRAEREVVLSAGAYGSAQLLMLSGIGPADHLRSLGIDVMADLPVGENLHDHMQVPMTFLTKKAVHRGTASYFGAAAAREVLRGGTWLARGAFEVAAFTKSSFATDVPDLEMHVLPWSYPAPNQNASVVQKIDPRRAFTVLVAMLYPKSRGKMRLASADPSVMPRIDPNYLSDPADAAVLLDGMELIRAAVADGKISSDLTELRPGSGYHSRDDLARDIPNRATTVFHPVGTCRMGADEKAVVDPQLRVRGIDGLRVADTSIMPSITGGNTAAPAMMIGEHASHLILHAAATASPAVRGHDYVAEGKST